MTHNTAPLAPPVQADALQPKKPRSKANGAATKKRSQPKKTSRPATAPTSSEAAQPVSMPVENIEQRDAELQEAATQEAVRREEQRRAAQQIAIARHRQAIAAIDGRERDALREFDTRRRTWPGVVIAIVRGSQHLEAQRRAIMDRHEADRMTLRREFTKEN